MQLLGANVKLVGGNSPPTSGSAPRSTYLFSLYQDLWKMCQQNPIDPALLIYFLGGGRLAFTGINPESSLLGRCFYWETAPAEKLAKRV